jgi:hypothetical protein
MMLPSISASAILTTSAPELLGADVGRYVGDFHLLIFAGCDRRTRNQADCVKTRPKRIPERRKMR